MSQSLEDYEREVLEEMHRFERRENPVLDAYFLVRYTSYRGRKVPVDVALVYDKHANTYTSWHLFPFDEVSSEILNCEDSENIFIATLLDGSSEPDR